VASSAS